ncbi:MAG: alpha/beta fold hydrolase [Bryobacterales bacterium]|nr:alpha/beta fold hydrolase [Bryobacterales bacterium]
MNRERTLYLHGFGSSPASKKAAFFRDRFREAGIEIEIPDLAEGRFERLTISGQLRVVEACAAGEPVTLIGSSMGGYLAALYAARHPETVRLVLLAPAFGLPGRWKEWLGEEKLRAWRETGSLNFYNYVEGRECAVSYGLIEDARQYEDMPRVTQPVRIFHGRFDTVVPVEYSLEFARGRSNVALDILDSDHELLSALDVMWQGTRAFLG